MEEKICPLMLITAISNRENADPACIQEKCGWWCEEYSGGEPIVSGHCAITDLASLADLAYVQY